MGKLALWILVAVIVMLLIRLIGTGKRRVRGDEDGSASSPSRRRGSKEASSPGSSGELIMGCAVCGVHLPSSDAVFAHGKVYCGAEHRDQDEAERPEGKG